SSGNHVAAVLQHDAATWPIHRSRLEDSMAEMSAPALRTAVIQALTSDAAFREALTKDPAGAIQARFGAQSTTPRVEFEKAGELSLVIPQQSPKLAEAIERAA